MFHRVMFCLLTVALVWLSGCGSSHVPIKGIVNLDGSPVEGATVTFVSEDGKSTYTGLSDATGNFTLKSTDNKEGILPGTYKVLVVKSPKFAGEVASGSPDYLKQVEKDKAAAKPAMPKSGMPGMKPPVAGPKGSKSELPAVYASVTSTTLTVKVPPDTQPVVLDLKSK